MRVADRYHVAVVLHEVHLGEIDHFSDAGTVLSRVAVPKVNRLLVEGYI